MKNSIRPLSIRYRRHDRVCGVGVAYTRPNDNLQRPTFGDDICNLIRERYETAGDSYARR